MTQPLWGWPDSPPGASMTPSRLTNSVTIRSAICLPFAGLRASIVDQRPGADIDSGGGHRAGAVGGDEGGHLGDVGEGRGASEQGRVDDPALDPVAVAAELGRQRLGD